MKTTTTDSTTTTTTTKHTPGPWHSDICTSNTALSSVHCFGPIPAIHRPWNVAICCGPQSAANARLIASAPTILCMLERMVVEATMSEAAMAHFAPLTLEQARAAIQRATA